MLELIQTDTGASTAGTSSLEVTERHSWSVANASALSASEPGRVAQKATRPGLDRVDRPTGNGGRRDLDHAEAELQRSQGQGRPGTERERALTSTHGRSTS